MAPSPLYQSPHSPNSQSAPPLPPPSQHMNQHPHLTVVPGPGVSCRRQARAGGIVSPLPCTCSLERHIPPQSPRSQLASHGLSGHR
mmetsp:Transcript_64813/g.115293  ORF Transcript_64813/g.115293 Transcript_64813/m.115293 type:complete len:86 (-) Transcript_64813:290-547(-)